jgi:hypothetical protein
MQGATPRSLKLPLRFMDGPPCWLSLLLSSPASSTSRQRFGAWKGALEQLMSRRSAAPGPASAMLSAAEVALPTQQIRPMYDPADLMYIDAASESPRRKCAQKRFRSPNCAEEISSSAQRRGK